MPDATEPARRQRLAEINSQPGSREAHEAQHGQVWDKGGKPFEVWTEIEDGKSIIGVELLAGDKVVSVEIDAVTGKSLKVEEKSD